MDPDLVAPAPLPPESLPFWFWLIVLGLAGKTLWLGTSALVHYLDAAHRPGAEQPPLKQYLRVFASEWYCSFGIILSYLFGYLPRLRPYQYDPKGGPPIALVHGYSLNRTCLFALYWRLRRLGYTNVLTFNLRPMFGSLEDMGEALAADLREFSQQAGANSLTVVAHSMGGLLARRIRGAESAPISKIIAIGSPFQGTILAALAMGANARDMRLNSPALAQAKDLPPVDVALWTPLDWVVIPSASSALGTTVLKCPNAGHLSLLFLAEAFDMLIPHLPTMARHTSSSTSQNPRGGQKAVSAL